MADEKQKPVGAKIIDGFGNAAERVVEIGESVAPYAAAALFPAITGVVKGAELVGDTMDYYNRGDDQMTAAMNAQNPTPLGGSGYTQLSSIGSEGDINDIILNGLAMEKTAPLTANEATVAADPRGVGAVPLDPVTQQGTASSVKDPNYVPPVTAEQIASGGPQFSNPMNRAFDTQALGIKQAADTGVLAAAADHAYQEKKYKYAEEAQEKTEDLNNAFNLDFQERMDGLTASMKEYKELAGQKVIPGAFLARQDTSGALSTGISVALGAMAGALNGTNQNIGLEMINKAIDRDVAQQQFNLEHATKIKGQDINNQSSLLAKMKDKFTDDKSAILATKTVMTSMAMDKMNAKLTEVGGARSMGIKSQANLAMGALLEKKISYEMQLKAAQESAFQKQEAMRGVDFYDMSNEQANALLGPAANMYVRGYGSTTDPQLAKDFIQKVKPMGDTIRKLKNSMANIDKLSMFVPSENAQLKAIMADLQLTLKDEENYKLGVLAGLDMNILKEVTGDPTSLNPLTNIGTQAKLKSTLQNIEAKMNGKIKDYGFDDPAKRPGSIKSKVRITSPAE